MNFRKYLSLGRLRPPVMIAFEHLYSEYLTLKPRIDDDEAKVLIEKLVEKKERKALEWNDLYFFELTLAEYLPVEKLRSKIMRLRYDYRKVVGEKEFDDYLAAKPPDLQSPPQPADPPHATEAHYEKLLREDLKDLLGRMYMEYAILPVREERLNALTWYAAGLCLAALGVLLVILAIMFLVPVLSDLHLRNDWGGELMKLRRKDELASLTIFVVVVAGAMGGFVSALQRIQSPTADGDSIYNLSLLFHGSNTVFVAPITGSIFATLLYLLFTCNIVSGSFFPTIFTPTDDDHEHAAVVSAGRSTNTNTNTVSPTPIPSSDEVNVNSFSRLPTSTPTSTPSPPPVTTNSVKAPPDRGLNVLEFLARSGPGSGKDYAMLIVWCFIAGFAERFVPDVLDRLISNGKTATGK